MFFRILLAVLTFSLLPIGTLEAASGAGVSQCARPTAARAGCFAKALSARPEAAPAGYSPAQLRAAYGAAGSGSARIAIVDAYGDSHIKADLDVYSRTFGLPVLPACTSATQTGCFHQTDQVGGTNFPRANSGWGLETALDVETVHAICPGCRIELVQATSASMANLLAAVDQAVRSGAQIVSLSWGGSETATEITADAHFTPGISFVASSGDSGYGTSWPAASSRAIAVGGTSLRLSATGARLAETAWSGAGSGCSKYEPKPAWQHDAACSRRSVADVAAVADPATGAAIYSSLASGGAGWYTVGGTSLAAPVIAGLIGLAGPATPSVLLPRLYGGLGTSRLHDIVSGINGSCANYFCSAGVGYDGPTGVGTPFGLALL